MPLVLNFSHASQLSMYAQHNSSQLLAYRSQPHFGRKVSYNLSFADRLLLLRTLAQLLSEPSFAAPRHRKSAVRQSASHRLGSRANPWLCWADHKATSFQSHSSTQNYACMQPTRPPTYVPQIKQPTVRQSRLGVGPSVGHSPWAVSSAPRLRGGYRHLTPHSRPRRSACIGR